MNIDKPLVSIIIPCYNDIKFIEQAFNSVLAQTYSNIEITIIDDGSNKETKQVLQKLKTKGKGARLITQENMGVCVARNVGVKSSNGEYILTLDSDDFFEPHFLDKAMKVIYSNQDIGMVTCWANVIDEKGAQMYVQKPTGSGASEALYKNNSSGSNLFLKKAWEEVGGYDLNMKNGFEDWEFNISISKKGWRVHVIPEILFNYRLKLKSRNSIAYSSQKELRSYVFKKHRDIAIDDFDYTIDFFLNEIEMIRQHGESYRNSKSYKIGHSIILFFKKILSIFGLFKTKR